MESVISNNFPPEATPAMTSLLAGFSFLTFLNKTTAIPPPSHTRYHTVAVT